MTVQFSRSSSAAIGLPTRLERPMTTASAPASARTPRAASAGSHRACTAPAPGPPLHKPTDIVRMKAIDILRRDRSLRSRAARRSAAAAAIAPGCRRPLSSALSRAISAESSASLALAGRLLLEASEPGFGRGFGLVADIDLAGRIVADQHRAEAGTDAERSKSGRAATAWRNVSRALCHRSAACINHARALR